MIARDISGWKRLIIALSIVLVGMALVPYIALPSERFSWQLFAGVYGDGPSLAISYDDGAPGSSFTVTGVNYPADATVVVKVNGQTLGSTVTDDIGGFRIRIDTTPQTDLGLYEVEVEVELDDDSRLAAVSVSGATRFRLSAGAPLRAADQDVLAAFNVPDGIAQNPVYMPLVFR